MTDKTPNSSAPKEINCDRNNKSSQTILENPFKVLKFICKSRNKLIGSRGGLIATSSNHLSILPSSVNTYNDKPQQMDILELIDQSRSKLERSRKLVGDILIHNNPDTCKGYIKKHKLNELDNPDHITSTTASSLSNQNFNEQKDNSKKRKVPEYSSEIIDEIVKSKRMKSDSSKIKTKTELREDFISKLINPESLERKYCDKMHKNKEQEKTCNTR